MEGDLQRAECRVWRARKEIHREQSVEQVELRKRSAESRL